MPKVRLSLQGLPLPLLTPRLRLEPPTERRAGTIGPLIGDARVARWLLNVPHPYRPADGVAFARRSRLQRRRGEALAFFIVSRETGELMGGIGLHNVRALHRRAELGYWIGAPYWHQGYAYEAAQAVLALSFDRLRLHRLEGRVYPENRRSAALLRKLGFRREGRLRESIWHWGRWEDDVCYGITEEAYRALPKGRRRVGRVRPRGAPGAKKPFV